MLRLVVQTVTWSILASGEVRAVDSYRLQPCGLTHHEYARVVSCSVVGLPGTGPPARQFALGSPALPAGGGGRKPRRSPDLSRICGSFGLHRDGPNAKVRGELLKEQLVSAQGYRSGGHGDRWRCLSRYDCTKCRSGRNSQLCAGVRTGLDAERAFVNQRMENDLPKTTSVLGECVHNRIARGVKQLPLDNAASSNAVSLFVRIFVGIRGRHRFRSLTADR